MSKKRNIVMPTDEEDAAITRAAAAEPDARELSNDAMERMRPARDVLPLQIGAKRAGDLLKRRGRPPGGNNKVATNVRYDRDVVDAFKATGDGWQTRMNDVLRDWAQSHGLISRH
jgi:uncharacterized protein (DUF4415 family)